MKLQKSSTATDPFLLLIIHSVRMTVRWEQALGCVLTIFCSYLPMYLHRHIPVVKICSIDVISSVRYILKSPDLFTAMQIVRRQLDALEELVDATCALVQKHLHTRALGRAGLSMHFIVQPSVPWCTAALGHFLSSLHVIVSSSCFAFNNFWCHLCRCVEALSQPATFDLSPV